MHQIHRPQLTSGFQLFIKPTLAPAEIIELGRFRREVYEHQQVLIPADELDDYRGWTDPCDYDPAAVHVIIRHQCRIVGASRISVHQNLGDIPDAFPFGDEMKPFQGPYGSLNRLVVDPTFRGMNLASALVKIRIGIAAAMGAATLVSCAIGERRRAFFEGIGFTTLSAMKDPTWDLGDTKVYKVVKRVGPETAKS